MNRDEPRAQPIPANFIDGTGLREPPLPALVRLRERAMQTLAAAHRRMHDGARHGLVFRLAAAEVFFRQRLALWRLDYAAGLAVPALRRNLLDVFRALGNWQQLFADLQAGRGRAGAGLPGNLREPRHYHDALQLAALTHLFKLGPQREALARSLRADPALDALLASLLDLSDDGLPGAPRGYELLLDATRAFSAEAARSFLSQYCQLRHARLPAGRPAPWCFEAAALWPASEASAFPVLLPMDLIGPWRPRRRQDLTPLLAIDRRVPRRRSQARRRTGMATTLSLAVSCPQPLLLAAPASACEAAPARAGLPVECGVASWYGPGFQGRPTANGERFDTHIFTAAHRSLPLPSYVHVRNLRNQREVVVVVNDRGPYVDERVLDLSLGAARQLGMVEPGLAEVAITRLSEADVAAWSARRSFAPEQRPITAVALPAPVVLPTLPSHAGGLAALLDLPKSAERRGEVPPPPPLPRGEGMRRLIAALQAAAGAELPRMQPASLVLDEAPEPAPPLGRAPSLGGLRALLDEAPPEPALPTVSDFVDTQPAELSPDEPAPADLADFAEPPAMIVLDLPLLDPLDAREDAEPAPQPEPRLSILASEPAAAPLLRLTRLAGALSMPASAPAAFRLSQVPSAAALRAAVQPRPAPAVVQVPRSPVQKAVPIARPVSLPAKPGEPGLIERLGSLAREGWRGALNWFKGIGKE